MIPSKTELKWAVYFTLMTIIWVVFEKAIGLHDIHIEKQVTFTYFYAIPAILIYFLALREKKMKDYSGMMTYRQGLISGIWLTLFTSIMAPFNIYLIFTYISPDFLQNAKISAVANELMDLQTAEAYFTISNYIQESLKSTPIFGLFTTALVTLFVRTKLSAT
jgi:hypothetical protein